jgi:LysM repeat protein
LKVTSSQIIAANPGVDWTRLKIGQKIFIPDSSAP